MRKMRPESPMTFRREKLTLLLRVDSVIVGGECVLLLATIAVFFDDKSAAVFQVVRNIALL